ncbi:sensor histidine kinase [Clostridium estertheticum]|uniref:sensor histidine kinase n=1 Tax=Clostridium estertheticum TaxID=238834 RepID=UPI001C7DAEF7|nr:GHKL domain-containing protein [Clostridium estertheticum]MBX4270429.1 GHKL domain-containing protein [Clostridium estertheticum]WLC81322.1 GHKL domain-containing protein [Clostridium estertheticum]
MSFESSIIVILNSLIIPSILMSILCCISIYILNKELIRKEEIRKCFFISFIIGIFISTGSYSIILPAFCIITTFQLKNNRSNIKALLIIYVVYLFHTLYIFVYTFSGKSLYNIPTTRYSFLEFIILLPVIILSCLIIKSIVKRKKGYKKHTADKLRFRIILIISLPLTLMIFGIFPLIRANAIDNDKIHFITGNFIPAVLPLIAIILITIIVYNYDKSLEYSVKLKREIDEKKEIMEYSNMIEEMYGETRRFKHDYMNMLTPLKEYIDKADIEGLREFFYDNIIDMDKDIKWSNNNIDKLKYIKVDGLKAILSTKLIKAAGLNIDIKVEIIEDIQNIAMNIMDLCRIIGILLDNAIESAQKSEYPKLYVCLVNKDNYVTIVIENNFFGQKPKIYKIYEEGYSTNGKRRGLGLYSVKQILDKKYHNAFLNTSIEGNMFVQELWIKYI